MPQISCTNFRLILQPIDQFAAPEVLVFQGAISITLFSMQLPLVAERVNFFRFVAQIVNLIQRGVMQSDLFACCKLYGDKRRGFFIHYRKFGVYFEFALLEGLEAER